MKIIGLDIAISCCSRFYDRLIKLQDNARNKRFEIIDRSIAIGYKTKGQEEDIALLQSLNTTLTDQLRYLSYLLQKLKRVRDFEE